jgi:transcriptional regulator with XRE-family HTH domain
MPQATPKRSGRKPKPGGRFPGQILAENVRTWRNVRRLSQAQLAERMANLGHPWSESIVGFVEQNRRNVTVDEYVGLHFALELDDFGALLDPLGVEGEKYRSPYDTVDKPGLDYGGMKPLPAGYVSSWVRGGVIARGTWTDNRIQYVFGASLTAIVEEGSASDTLHVQKSTEP